ncbi:MAG TPA: biotin carboxylase N-terminal domain-containing protein, partial [Candidatus Limnocylindrales bacterium]|nr:biotin carboxylase N-terminal domain-containing protein [Candidatus Limnocylindrales bacterium]
RMADQAVRLGPAPAADSYLRADLVIEAAQRTGAEAIHPGYGFLSERASFAEAVEAAGLLFVGPSAAAIARVGDKLAARRLAIAAGVPVVPGTLAPAIGRPEELPAAVADAERIGFPLLVKTAAGGGGRGMRRVDRPAELPAALAAGAAEAAAAFGDGTVYLEKLIAPARHIEVQLLGGADGTVIALGERDCSLQRRHQKLVEESPAPGITAAERRALHAMAVHVGEVAGLRNASTAEFLFDMDRQFWFLEVNTRLQVEHGVTELVADLDLVREQLRIAAGRPFSAAALAAARRADEPERHAIEVRISAEDPIRAFAPEPGTIGRWRMPSGPGVRVDAAVEAGEPVPPDYDPLIAKLLVVDADRDAAIERLDRALDEVEVTGIQTTLPFHRFVARHAGFRAAELSTAWVEEEWEPIAAADRAHALTIASRAAAAAATERVAPASPPGEPGAAGPVTSARDATLGDRSGRPSGWREAARVDATDRWPR